MCVCVCVCVCVLAGAEALEAIRKATAVCVCVLKRARPCLALAKEDKTARALLCARESIVKILEVRVLAGRGRGGCPFFSCFFFVGISGFAA